MSRYLLIIALSFLISCSSEKENSTNEPFLFKTLKDTTYLFNHSSVEKQNIKYLKQFVKNEQNVLTKQKLTVPEIDSVFKLKLRKAKIFNGIQDKVLIRFNLQKDVGEYNDTYYFVSIKNGTEYYIQAAEIAVHFFDLYKNKINNLYGGSRSINFKKALAPDSLYQKKVLRTGENSILQGYVKIFTVSYVARIVFSKKRNIESKSDAVVYNLKNTYYSYPISIGLPMHITEWVLEEPNI